MSLRQKSISAFFWASSQQVLVLVLNLTISIILARILEPEEFGLIGMISVFVAVGKVLMSGGLASSLIRTKDPTQKEFSTVFFANLFFSLLFYLLIFLVAEYIASFFERPVLTDIIRVYSVVVIIFSFSAVQYAKLTKELKFKLAMSIKLPSIIIGGIVGISMAYSGFGVWSLVGMYLTQAIIDVFQLWSRSGWKPSLEFSYLDFNKHFSFGSRLTLIGILNAVYQNIYNLIIGKYFSAQQLGFYTRSSTLAQLPVTNLQEVILKVTYPILSSIQDDNERLKRTYKEIVQSVMLIILPVLMLGIILAEPLFRFFLTEKWLPAVPYFQLLCVVGFFVPLSTNNLNILKVKGKSGVILKLGLIEKVSIGIGLFLVVPFGIYALLYLQIIMAIFAFLMNAQYSGSFIGYNAYNQTKDLLRLFFCAIAAGFTAFYFNLYIKDDLQDLLLIAVISIFYLIVYMMIIYFLDKSIISNMKKLLLSKIKS